ncbi:MAG: alanine racemase [Candidatus Omnitrophota bacterium]
MKKPRYAICDMRYARRKIQHTHYRPTWAEVDLGAIKYNLSQVKRVIGKDTSILVAVKANAYGHGILEVSRVLVSSGVDFLGVGTTDEAVLLRNNGFKIPILILGSILPSEAEAVIKNNISHTVGSIELASFINRVSARMGRRAKVHIKIDTGMGRIGIWHKDAVCFIKELVRFKNINIEGIFSHFPSADDNELLTRKQIRDFQAIINEIESLGIDIRYKHMANSTALVGYKESHMNLVRPGLMLYGLYPLSYSSKRKAILRPALSLKSRISFIKDVPSGRTISYGGTYKTRRAAKVATIPIGYGDGYSRRLSNKGHVLVKGIRVKILGIVCMDQIMADVTNVPGVSVGDKVTLIGKDKGCGITVEEIAEICETIPYEVVCWFDNRIPRIYIE